MSLRLRIYPDSEEKHNKEFDSRWKSCRKIRERLSEVYTEELEALLKDDEDIKHLSEPNWTERQAFNLGMRKAFRKIIKDLNSEA